MWHQMKLLPLACWHHWVQGLRIGWAMQSSAFTLMPPSSEYLANAFTWSSNPKEENIKWSCYKPTPAANSNDPQIWDACTTWGGIGTWDEASTARDIILNQSSIGQVSASYKKDLNTIRTQTDTWIKPRIILAFIWSVGIWSLAIWMISSDMPTIIWASSWLRWVMSDSWAMATTMMTGSNDEHTLNFWSTRITWTKDSIAQWLEIIFFTPSSTTACKLRAHSLHKQK